MWQRVYKMKKHNYTIKKKAHTKLQCQNCKYIFANFLKQCPECGSEKLTGYSEVNPYSRLPLESILKASGHVMWLGGTVLFLFFLWNTDSTDNEVNMLMIRYALMSLIIGVLCSVLYIGVSEIIHRTLLVQRRLKAFHQNQNPPKQKKQSRRNSLMQYGMCTNKKK